MSLEFVVERLESRQLLSGTIAPRLVPQEFTAKALAADPTLANFRTFDLQVTIRDTNDWVGANLKIDLSAGSFYIPPGHNIQPKLSSWASHPENRFDTFVCAPKYAQAELRGGFDTNTPTINSNSISVTWIDSVTTGPGSYTVARLTLSNDARGTLIGNFAQTDSQDLVHFSSSIPLPANGGGQISGSVWMDDSSDGTKDGSEGNLGGARIYLDANNNGQLDTGELTTKTHSNGKYYFHDLPASTYIVRPAPATGLRPSFPAAPDQFYKVKLMKGGSAIGKRFGLTARSIIKGTVFNDGDGDGTKGPLEGGRAGFTVFIDFNGNGMMDAGESNVSNDDGSFAFAGLLPGRYLIGCANKTGFKRTTPASVVLDLAAGEIRTGVLFGEKRIS